jgi:hypothetical protein
MDRYQSIHLQVAVKISRYDEKMDRVQKLLGMRFAIPVIVL